MYVCFGCSDSSSDLLLSPLISTDLLCFPLMEFSSHLPTIPLEFLWELLGFVCERVWPVCGNSPTVSCPLTKVWPLERNPSPWDYWCCGDTRTPLWGLIGQIRPGGGSDLWSASVWCSFVTFTLPGAERRVSHKSRFSGESCVFALATLIRGYFWPKYDGPLVVYKRLFQTQCRYRGYRRCLVEMHAGILWL